MEVNFEEILKKVPIRKPVLCVDGIDQIKYGEYVSGYKVVDKNEDWAKAHFVDDPVLPGTMIIETMAQVSGFIFYDAKQTKSLKGFLGKVNNIKFLQRVVPDCKLYVESRLVAKIDKTARMSCKATVNEKLVATGDITLFYTESIV